MTIQMKSFLIILVVFMFSCKDKNRENKLPNSAQNKTLNKENQENEIEKIKVVKGTVIKQLQGKWKEIAYPYRTAEFVRSTVKFIEEGTDKELKFENFDVSEACHFDNNNIRDLKLGDIILILPETNRCEKLKILNDTLTLSGFSTNSNENYNIVYLKLKW